MSGDIFVATTWKGEKVAPDILGVETKDAAKYSIILWCITPGLPPAGIYALHNSLP